MLAQAHEYAFGTLQGKESATTVEVAEFYGVEQATLRKSIERNRAELEGYGLKTLRGKELKIVSDSMSLSKNVRQLTLWTPTATLALLVNIGGERNSPKRSESNVNGGDRN